MDKGIPRQQNLSRFDLAVVPLRAKSNAHEEPAPLMDEVNSPPYSAPCAVGKMRQA